MKLDYAYGAYTNYAYISGPECWNRIITQVFFSPPKIVLSDCCVTFKQINGVKRNTLIASYKAVFTHWKAVK